MNINFSITLLASISAVALVSCEQPSRVVDRPLGTSPVFPTNPGDTGINTGENLIGQLDNPDTLGGTGLNPNPGSDTNTIGNTIMGGNNTPPRVNPQVPNNPATGNAGSSTNENIMVAWPDPNDPTVVRSPYDQTRKIRVIKADGTVYPPGTVLRDPVTGQKFKMP